jgi:hypothetical protein
MQAVASTSRAAKNEHTKASASPVALPADLSTTPKAGATQRYCDFVETDRETLRAMTPLAVLLLLGCALGAPDGEDESLVAAGLKMTLRKPATVTTTAPAKPAEELTTRALVAEKRARSSGASTSDKDRVSVEMVEEGAGEGQGEEEDWVKVKLMKRIAERRRATEATTAPTETPQATGIWSELKYPDVWDLLRDAPAEADREAEPPKATSDVLQPLLTAVSAAEVDSFSTVLLFGDSGGHAAGALADALPGDATILSMVSDEEELKQHSKRARRSRVVFGMAALTAETVEALLADVFWAQYVVVMNVTKFLQHSVPKEMEMLLAKLAQLGEHLVVQLPVAGGALRVWQDDPQVLLRAVIARGGLQGAMVRSFGGGLFRLSLRAVGRAVSVGGGSDAPNWKLVFRASWKRAMPTRFAVTLENALGQAVPADVFGVSLKTLNTLKVSHFSRRYLFELYSAEIPSRFLALHSVPSNVTAQVASAAMSQKAADWYSTVALGVQYVSSVATSATMAPTDLWLCGSQLAFDPTLSVFARNELESKMREPKARGPSVGRKLLAWEQPDVENRAQRLLERVRGGKRAALGRRSAKPDSTENIADAREQKKEFVAAYGELDRADEVREKDSRLTKDKLVPRNADVTGTQSEEEPQRKGRNAEKVMPERRNSEKEGELRRGKKRKSRPVTERSAASGKKEASKWGFFGARAEEENGRLSESSTLGGLQNKESNGGILPKEMEGSVGAEAGDARRREELRGQFQVTQEEKKTTTSSDRMRFGRRTRLRGGGVKAEHTSPTAGRLPRRKRARPAAPLKEWSFPAPVDSANAQPDDAEATEAKDAKEAKEAGEGGGPLAFVPLLAGRRLAGAELWELLQDVLPDPNVPSDFSLLYHECSEGDVSLKVAKEFPGATIVSYTSTREDAETLAASAQAMGVKNNLVGSPSHFAQAASHDPVERACCATFARRWICSTTRLSPRSFLRCCCIIRSRTLRRCWEAALAWRAPRW